jgi:nucleoside-diphosphate-sugar epimerase
MSFPCVLVSGATGFLGRHVLEAAVARRWRSVALVRDRRSWGEQPWQAQLKGVAVLRGSPLEPDAWCNAARQLGVTSVVHAAGRVEHSRHDPEPMLELNVHGTLQMVRAAHAIGARISFVSSSGTVGCFRTPDTHADEHAPHAEALAGRWPYYASKMRAEREARVLADQLGVELCVVRPPVLLGPGDHRRRSTGYVQKVLDGKIPAVPPGGMHFTDVRDVANALLQLCAQPALRPIYHLPGTSSTLAQFITRVAELAGTSPVRRPLPRWAALGLSKLSASLERRPSWLPDPVVLEMSTCHWGLSSLYASEIGYQPRPAAETLRDTIDWLRSHAPSSAAAPLLGAEALPAQ